MKRISWLVLFGLTLALPAHAASFDCAKASTNIEKMICSNPELSKLDDELVTRYKAALKNKGQSNAIRHTQKLWVKERNVCVDSACIHAAYQKRIKELSSFINAVPQQSFPQTALLDGRDGTTASGAGKYIGKVYSFGELPGFAFSDKKNSSSDSEYLQLLFIGNKYFLLAKENERQHSVVVVDAVAIPKGQIFIGRPIEDECEDPKLPNETIFVVGKWVDRRMKTGAFAGGYAHPINRAWRVNFDKKRFEEIPTLGIKCEDNRTDADID